MKSNNNKQVNDRILLQNSIIDYEFLLQDRIQKIQSINNQYDLEHNGYLSFSGGKDSTVLHYLVDMALPGNNIPRLFLNTGIEYKLIVQFVKELAEKDNRFVFVQPSQNIKDMLEEYGYPFKSKDHAQKVAVYQRNGMTKTPSDYIGLTGNKGKTWLCPDKLKYQFTPEFKLKISDKCCFKLKKEPAEKWAKENNRPISITGVRGAEGGLRRSMQGCTTFSGDKLHKFHPLFPLTDDWLDEFIKRNDIELCKLYYEPYSFERTGCCGCPFNPKLQSQLEMLKEKLPTEYKHCEIVWKPVYDEYRKVGYRLK